MRRGKGKFPQLFFPVSVTFPSSLHLLAIMAPPRSAVAQKLQKEQDDLLPSEDEDDSDFHLSGGEDEDGGSDSSDSEREGEQRGKKRVKLEEETPKEPV